MANQLITIKELARLTLPRLLENLVFPNLCYRDLEQDITGRKLGDTIQIRKPVNLVAHDFDPAAGVTSQNIQEDTVDFTLNRIATVDARKALNLNKAPVSGRCAVWDAEADAAFTNLDCLVHADKAGRNEALQEGSIGRVMGFDNYMSQGVARHESGVTAAEGVKVNGAVAEGANTLSIKGTSLTGQLKKGDLLVIDGKNYTVTQDTDAASANVMAQVKVYPALPETNDGTAVTIMASHTANLAFCPMAFAFATRPLVAPAGVESYVTGFNGVNLRVVRGYDMQHKRELLSMDVLYGFKTLYPELAVRVMG